MNLPLSIIPRAHRSSTRRSVPRLEPLEERTLLSAEASLAQLLWHGHEVSAYAGSWIVQFADRSGSLIEQQSQLKSELDLRGLSGQFQVESHLGANGLFHLRSDSVVSYEAVMQSLSTLAGFLYVEPDLALSTPAIPSDSLLNDQWSLNNTGQTGGVVDADIDAPEAWESTQGSSSVIVGVVDTGIDYLHPDLASNIWVNPGEIAGNLLDDDGNGYVDDVHGYDFYFNDSDPMDLIGHGTHVAGTIGAVGNNGLGVAGVNWDVGLMALKISPDSGTSVSATAAVAAINYTTMMREVYGVNVRVTTHSWGGGGYLQSLYDAISESEQAGLLFVAAAGNGYLTNNDIFANYPSNYDVDNIIAVASTTHTDAISDFSNYGPTTVDLGAPGSSILSTTPNNTYSIYSGTSMATPHVTGVAALAWSYAPDATYQEIRDAILGGVDPLPSLNGLTVTGGRLNAARTLELLGFSARAEFPGDNTIVGIPPTDFLISFNSDVNPTTLEAGDLSVDGVVADALTVHDARTVAFHFNVSPIASEGEHVITMSAGSVARAGDGEALKPFESSFRYDVLRLQVVSSNPADGAVAPVGLTEIAFSFNESVLASSLSADDLELSRGTVVGASLFDATTVVFTVAGLESEGILNVGLAEGALTDPFGNPMLPYSSTIDLDVVTRPVTLWERIEPMGSLAYRSMGNNGLFNFAGDADSFVFDAVAGETFLLVIRTNDPSAIVEVTLPNLGGGVSSVVGDALVVTLGEAVSAGPFVFQLSADRFTSFSFDLYRNVAVELDDSTLTSALALDPSEFNAGVVRYAVLGRAIPGGSSSAALLSDRVVAYSADMSTNPNWTYQGDWAYGQPTGAGGYDPSSGFTGPNVVGYNLNGNYPNNLFPTQYVTTGPISVAGLEDVKLSFRRWMSIESAVFDEADIQVSSNGLVWTTLWQHTGGSFSDGSWQAVSYDIPESISEGGVLFLRWGLGPTDSSVVYGGWNIDDVVVDGVALEPEVDHFTIDLSDRTGTTLDIVLAGQSTDFTGATIELLNPDGIVVATSTSSSGENYAAGILSYQVADAGVYSIRVTSPVFGEYGLVVTDRGVFDTEPNGATETALRLLTPSNSALGHVGQALQDGQYRLELNSETSAVEVSFAVEIPDVETIEISPQSPGSLTAVLAGYIDIVVDNGSVYLSPSSQLELVDKPGPFQPGNSSADLAGTATIALATLNATLRNAVFGLFSTPQALSPTNTFPANSVVVESQSGLFEAVLGNLDLGGFGIGGVSTQNVSANNASLTFGGDAWTLAIPIDAAFEIFLQIAPGLNLEGNMSLVGDIVAAVGVDSLDSYEAVFSTGQTVTLSTTALLQDTGLGNTLVPTIAVSGPGGLIGESRIATPDGEILTFVVGTSGVYRIGVQSVSGGGEYRLDLDIEDPTSPPIVVDANIRDASNYEVSEISQIVLEFDEALDASVLGVSDVSLVREGFGSVTIDSIVYDSESRTLTLGFDPLGVGGYVFTLTSGSSAAVGLDGLALDGEASATTVPSGDGSAGGNFEIAFDVGQDVQAFPIALESKPPLGSLVYDPVVVDSLHFLGDVDSFTIEVDAGQVLSVVVDTIDPTLDIELVVRDPFLFEGVSDNLGFGGREVVQAFGPTVGGVYTIDVRSVGGEGAYQLNLILNALLESENGDAATNDILSHSESLAAGFISLEGQAARTAVLGELFGVDEDWYRFTLSAGSSATLALGLMSGNASLALFNAAGLLISQGTPAANVGQAIERFVALATGEYFARVSGQDASYNLVVARNSALDIESNGQLNLAQDITGTSGVLGHVNSDSGAGAGELVGPIPILTSFEGPTDFRFVPPDPILAVGPEQVVVLVNTQIGIYDKETGVPSFQQDLSYASGFFAEVGATSSIFDPHVLYDFETQRFYIIAIDVASSVESNVFLAVSKDSTPTGGDDWYKYKIDFTDSTPGLGTGAHFPDYPKIGVNQDAIFISANYFPIDSGDGVYAGITAISKDSLLSGGAAEIVYREMFNGFSVYPLIQYGDADAQYFVEAPWYGGNSLTIHAVRDVLTNPTRTTSTVSVSAFSSPIDVPQLGTFATLDSIDARVMSGVWRDGSIWATHGIVDPSLLDGENVARWYEIDTTGVSPTLVQSGNIDPGPGVHAWMPSINVDQSGNMGIGFSISGTGRFGGAGFTGRLAGDALGTTVLPISDLALGEGPHTTGRWGDYSGMAIDPSDETTFWTVHEYADLGGEWGTRVGSFQLQPAEDDDWYRFQASAGNSITLSTTTPADGAGVFANNLDVAIELYDANGLLLAADDNSGSDGRNAQIGYGVTQSGTYYVRVHGMESAGEYFLQLTGAVAPDLAPFVIDADPDAGAALSSAPTTYTLDFSEALQLTTVQASDLRIGGLAATSVSILDQDTLTFTINPAAIAGDGSYGVVMNAGVVRDLQGRGNTAFSTTFSVDTTGPIIVATTWNGEAFPTTATLVDGTLVFQAQFNEDLETIASARRGPLVPGKNSIRLIDNRTGLLYAATSVSYDAETDLFTASFSSLPEGEFTLTLFSGSTGIEDVVGNDMDGEPLGGNLDGTPTGDGILGGDYFVNFSLDSDEADLGDFVRLEPLGGLVFASRGNTGLINFAGDSDDLLFFAHAGETISAVLQSIDQAAILSIELVGLAGPVVASGVDQLAVLQSIAIAADGIYRLRVAGNGASEFSLSVYRNAALEIDDSGPNAPQSIEGSFADLGSGRYSVFGSSDPTMATAALFAVQPSSGQILALDVATGLELYRIAAPDGLAANHTNIGLAFSPSDGTLLYVNSDVDPTAIYRLNPRTGEVVSIESATAPVVDGLGSTSEPIQTVVFSTDFEGGLGGFTIDNNVGLGDGQWHLSTGRSNTPGHSSSQSIYFGANEDPDGGGNYNVSVEGAVFSPQIDLTGLSGTIELELNYFLSLEDFFDEASIRVLAGGISTEIADNNAIGNLLPFTNGFEALSLDLSDFAGQQIQLEFHFYSDVIIPFEGWYVDDIAIITTEPVSLLFLGEDGVQIRRQEGFSGPETLGWATGAPTGAIGGDGTAQQFGYFTDGFIHAYDPYVDTDSFLSTLSAPAADIEGMAYNGGSLFVSTSSGIVYALDAATGAVLGSYSVAGGGLFGLAIGGGGASGVEPDDYTDGTDLSGVADGVTLSVVNGFYSPTAFVVGESLAPTGDTVFASAPFDYGWYEFGAELRIDFEALARHVAIDVGSDDGFDVGVLRAYNADGVLLEQVFSSGLGTGQSETISIDRPGADIAYVIATGSGGEVVLLDNLQFDSGAFAVPDIDDYTIDASAGTVLDVVLEGQDGADLQSAVVELIGPDGQTVVATSSSSFGGSDIANFDVGIFDHEVAQSGVYTVRVRSFEDGEYVVVVTEDDAFNTNTSASVDRSLDAAGGAIGYVNSALPLGTTTFVIDATASTVTLSGGIYLPDSPDRLEIVEQLPGSLETFMGGQIVLAFDGSNVQILAGSFVDAVEQAGPFLPNNTPADFGGLVTIVPGLNLTGAVREAVLDFSGSSTPLAADGTFTVGTLFGEVISAFLDYALGPIAPATENLSGLTAFADAAGLAQLQVDGDSFVLNLPVSIEFSGTASVGALVVDLEVQFDFIAVARADASSVADSYVFHADAGDAIALDARALFTDEASSPGNDLVFSVQVFDPNGVLVTSAIASAVDGIEASIAFDAGLGGEYRVVVAGISGLGEYDLDVRTGAVPVASAGGPYVIHEGGILLGQPVTFDASASSDADGDTLSYRWDINGDGAFNDAFGVAPTLSWADLVGLGIDDGPQTRPIRVMVDDGNGNTAISDPAIFEIQNLPPIAAMIGPSAATVGDSVNFTLLAVDASPVDTVTPFEFEIDWNGDQVFDEFITGPFGTVVSHTFTTGGPIQIRFAASDKDGGRSFENVHSIQVQDWSVEQDVWEPGDMNLVWNGYAGDDHVVFEQVSPTSIRIRTFERNGVAVNETSVVHGVTGRIVANALAGADIIDGSALSTPMEVYGGADVDSIVGGSGGDILYGDFTGKSVTSSGDWIDGGAGDDTIYGDSNKGRGRDTILGGFGNDVIHADGAEGADDFIFAGDGNDFVDAGGGNDLVDGGAGDDLLSGGKGGKGSNDTLAGGDGDDVLIGDRGARGSDQLFGDAGQDLLLAFSIIATDTELHSIHAEWSSNHTFEARTANLLDGSGSADRLNGNYFLQGNPSVWADELVDAVLGGDDEDWLLFDPDNDLALDVNAEDLVTDLA